MTIKLLLFFRIEHYFHYPKSNHMDKETKLLYFEYLLNQLVEWYKESRGSYEGNDLSTLKAMKLLFFVSAADLKPNSTNTIIDTVFNNYVAMPYGHVESDIYDLIRSKSGVLNCFKIDNRTTVKLSKSVSELNLDKNYTVLIDSSISHLKESVFHLIDLTASDLIELSHQWYSWKHNFNLAISKGVRSAEIKIDDIKKEPKYFSPIYF